MSLKSENLADELVEFAQNKVRTRGMSSAFVLTSKVVGNGFVFDSVVLGDDMSVPELLFLLEWARSRIYNNYLGNPQPMPIENTVAPKKTGAKGRD